MPDAVSRFTAFQIPTKRLLAICNPLTNPWGAGRAIRRGEVLDALEAGRIEPTAFAPRNGWTRRQHIARIAWFTLHGWDDAIDIDIGVPELGVPLPRWPVLDGNHRLAAAAVRRLTRLSVDISGGESFAKRLLGVSFGNEGLPKKVPPLSARRVAALRA